MITVIVEKGFTVNQNEYNNIIFKRIGIDVECPSCNEKTRMHRHGKYSRKFISKKKNEDEKDEKNLEIVRLKCKKCKKTHAVLLSCMVPYCTIGLDEIIEVIEAPKSSADHTCVDQTRMLQIKKTYAENWKDKLIKEEITIDENIALNCLKKIKTQFMQERGGKNCYIR